MKILPCFISLLFFAGNIRGGTTTDADICIYGGTSAGVAAAVQAARMGKNVVLVTPEKHLGGLSSGGLGFTDVGSKASIGGISMEFYRRIADHYRQASAWNWQKQPAEAADGTPGRWVFEPHVAEGIYEDFIRENKIPVQRNEWLDRNQGVKKEGARIVSVTMLDGNTYRAREFIDATYEGDLMAAAGVEYTTGREANSVYNERLNGVQIGAQHHSHYFGKVPKKISPYVVPGDPASGVIPRISTDPPGETGQGDKKIQAYCYRMCLTDNPENRVPFPKPAGYDPGQYELLLRIFQAGWRETFKKFDRVPNQKTDVNNHGPMSTDDIGRNYDYPDASYEQRRVIIKEHQTYQQGLLYFIAHDPRVPREVQDRMQQWGLARDEFQDNGNWPYQLYVREARRMVSSVVLTEHELLKERPTADSVGMGSYPMDSHNVQRYIAPDGSVQNEGDMGEATRGAYPISYAALVSKPGQCDNLVVPVCVSSSHIAYGSIRMEPVFMILGQSAAAAAALAIDEKVPVQAVAYPKLRERLLADGQVLEPPQAIAKGKAPVKKVSEPGKTPGRPRVLLIGDSISIGYAPLVSERLQELAEVEHIPGNGSTSAHGVKMLSNWLGAEKWDVINFNFGIHDAKFAAPGRQEVPPGDYEKNLREFVKQLQTTGAKLIWCSTTPIPSGELKPARHFDDVAEYNRIAARVMAENNITINDLNAFITPHLAEYQKPRDVHFLRAGYEALAGQVASGIQAKLPRELRVEAGSPGGK